MLHYQILKVSKGDDGFDGDDGEHLPGVHDEAYEAFHERVAQHCKQEVGAYGEHHQIYHFETQLLVVRRVEAVPQYGDDLVVGGFDESVVYGF